MKLIIDRMINQKGIYSVAFGPDFDVLIYKENFYINIIPKEIMSDIDLIVTNSPNLIFCVLYIKHPVIMKDYTIFTEEHYKIKIRTFFAIRLKYRKHPVELFEDGRRLFKSTIW